MHLAGENESGVGERGHLDQQEVGHRADHVDREPRDRGEQTDPQQITQGVQVGGGEDVPHLLQSRALQVGQGDLASLIWSGGCAGRAAEHQAQENRHLLGPEEQQEIAAQTAEHPQREGADVARATADDLGNAFQGHRPGPGHLQVQGSSDQLRQRLGGVSRPRLAQCAEAGEVGHAPRPGGHQAALEA